MNLNAALAADLLHGKFDIGFYNYGTFYFYLVAFAHILGRGWGLIPQTPPGADVFSAQAAAENAALFLSGRLVTALLGAATIPVLFALGNRLFGKRAGYLAALLYAVAPLGVLHAHFLTVDAPATFFVTLALLGAAQVLARREAGETEETPLPLPGWREYALAGVWTGLAAATKYNTGLVLVAPVVAHFLNKRPEMCSRHRGAQFGVLIAIAMLTFLLACPGPWLNLEAFWEGLPNYPGSGVRYELFEHSRAGHGELFLNTGPGWLYHLIVSLRYGLGAPLLLLGLGGVAFACVRRTRQDWVLLAFLVLYYFSTSLSAVRFARYMLPIVPVLCLFAARLVAEPFPRSAIRRLMAVCGTAAVLSCGVSSALFVRGMRLPDPRDAAADYLERNARQGASIAFAKVPWFFSPPLSPRFGAPAAPMRALAAEQTTRYQLRIPATEWDTSLLAPPPDFVLLSDFELNPAYTRLRLPAPTQFVQATLNSPNYSARTFRPPVAGSVSLLFDPDNFPEDMRYTLPTVLVLQRR